ncbi:hypothetical protein KDU71_02415 [Carboxylicivirga sediminis]|uniref:Uncharacterized protein n=1 Tax=Carboxylicivirga sediminis TaxID=2006564 RepID=A0A941F1B4_9BACT|nr:hypothetical protein [Carboxylicivirga sediminis]MBR8534398.1 hypothetical protein [Carboxylicivirga sediminis]
MKEQLINLVNQEFKGKGMIASIENDKTITIAKASKIEAMQLEYNKESGEIFVMQVGRYSINDLREA